MNNSPAVVRDHFITLRGMAFHYREWSTAGVPLILLHGLASQSHIFDLVAPLLARPSAEHQNFRVIAFDQRGHGESVKPEEDFDFQTVSADLLALLDAIQIKRAIVAGHSWGGNVALYFAANFPARTRGLVLIDGGFLDIQANPEMTWERTEKELAPPNLIGTPVDAFKARIKQYAGERWKPSLERIVLENFQVQPDHTIAPRLSFGRHMKILRALWEMRPRQFYPRVVCPTLILPAEMKTGDNDAWLERHRTQVKNAAREIPHNRVVTFHNTIHDIPLQRPRKLAHVITRFAIDNKLIKT